MQEIERRKIIIERFLVCFDVRKNVFVIQFVTLLGLILIENDSVYFCGTCKNNMWSYYNITKVTKFLFDNNIVYVCKYTEMHCSDSFLCSLY